jgi:quinone-modifying oxidoreductase subunit QmoB
MADTENKIGCYICTGCDIGEALDIEALTKTAQKGCALCKTHPSLCDPEGVALIRKDIADEGLSGVAIAACSFRAKQKEFTFPELKRAVVRVNLREGVAWVLDPKEEDTQLLADDYVNMGLEQARRTKDYAPFSEGEFYRDILVIGGGVAGMTAAIEAAGAGSKVTLLERSSELGGNAGKWHKSVPMAAPWNELQDTGVAQLVDAVKSNERIDVHYEAEVEKIDGSPCKFDVAIKAGGKEIKAKIGAVVVATGFEPYAADKLGHLGYGQFKDVVTSVELEEMVKAGAVKRPSDGGPVKNVLFIQCAGSRDQEHLAYCSTICCNTTLKQATYLKENDPDSQAYILYKDIRTPGQREDFYRKVQQDGAVFIRGEFKEMAQQGGAGAGGAAPSTPIGNGKLTAFAHDLLLAEDVEIQDLDLVVLAVGQVPTTKMEGETVEPLEGDAVLDKHNILKLGYRQGPELPNLRYGYPDSHYICFPYETRRTGIYAAGTVRRAMDIPSAKRDGAGAALKAIQCVELTAGGAAVHPRAGDVSYPEFFMQRCTQCKRCTEECPFGAINEDEKYNPLPNPTRCRRCGVCMGACPERIISFKDYAVDMIGAMLKEIEVPDEFEEKPCVLAMACENDAWPVLDALAARRQKTSPYVRWIPLRCMGGMNLVWIADALSKGIDGVLFLGCKHGDDYQCHFIKGSELCETRLSKVQETLDRLMLESDRIRFEQIAMTDADKVPGIIEEFMEKMEEVGPNPYKGM